MSLQLKKTKQPFTMVPNELLNSSLTLKAKGMYCYMYSKPDNWNFTIRSIAKQLPEGVESISNSIRELKGAGWLIYNKLKTGKGVYTLVFEPNTENPNQDNPKLGKHVPISNKDINSNKDNTTTTIIKQEEALTFFNSYFSNPDLKHFNFEFKKFKNLNEYDNRTFKNWQRWCIQLKEFNKKWGKSI